MQPTGKTETAAAASPQPSEIPPPAAYNHAPAYNHAVPLRDLLMTSRTGSNDVTTTEASIKRQLTFLVGYYYSVYAYVLICRATHNNGTYCSMLQVNEAIERFWV